MPDRFLHEVQVMHRMREEIRGLPDEAREAFMSKVAHAGKDWVFVARDAQLPPPDLDWCWLFLGGRGAGRAIRCRQLFTPPSGQGSPGFI